MTEEIKVLGTWVSPFVTRVRIALNLKGLDYEFIPDNYANKSELLLKSNPVYKKVPVLIHNGKSICESMNIVQYIDETWPSSFGNNILSADAYDRSVARFWAAYIDGKGFQGTSKIIFGYTDEDRAEGAEQLSAGLLLLEEAFKKCSNGKGFFGGDTIGYLDIALGARLSWFSAYGKMLGVEFLDKEKIPLLVGWAERFRSHEAVKVVMPETDELVEAVPMLRELLGGPPPTK